MDHFTQLLPFEIAFGEPYSRSQEPKHQDAQNEQQPTYQGIPVQVLSTPFQVYHSQSDKDNNNPGPFGSLDKYNIAFLTHADQEAPHGTDIAEVPQSGRNEYSFCHSDTTPLEDAPLSTPDTHLTQLLCILGSELEVNEPMPASHSASDYQLTNLPDMLSNPQNSGTVTVVNLQNQNQTTIDNQTPQAVEDVSNNTSAVEHQKSYQNHPDHSKRIRAYQRRSHFRNNSAYAKRQREKQRERYRNDPDYAERIRERQRERLKDPVYVEHNNRRQKERYQNDPDFAERMRKRMRENMRKRYQNDPGYSERMKKRMKERMKDPAKLENDKIRKRERQREYLREYRRKRRSELRKDPACVAIACTNPFNHELCKVTNKY
ncbi:hypothetical protein [Endozoicomonas sp. ALB091]|uniref:hypothetical protein n=1 Tax=Endozoicomonas sp. ALB091 TaxID=3403073 RepID=UPI003BB6E6B2